MLALLPLVCFVALCLGFLLYEPRVSWRRALLSAGVVWGVVVTIITEALNGLTALTFAGVLVAWLLALTIVALVVVALFRLRPQSIAVLDTRLRALVALFRRETARHDLKTRQRAWPLAAALAGALLIIATTGLVALAAAPNNWDSMTFHLARVMFWMEHASLNPYPTDIMRQIYEAPWAEYCVAQFYLLSGSDHLSALVQWWAMAASVAGVSLIARQLGAARSGQIFAAIFAATLPMGILQGSSTQNDYVVTFWFVCFTHFALAFRKRPSSMWNTLGLGASLGLAMLTKATTYVYAPPFLLLLGYWAIRRLRWRVWEVTLVAGCLALILNVGYYIRNLRAFGAVFGPSDEVSRYANAQFTPATLTANGIRDLALQIGSPWFHVNAALDGAIRSIFSLLRLDINDPATSWQAYAFNPLSLHEDYAGAPLHFLMILGVVALFLGAPRLRADRLALAYIATLVASFLVFALYLKWQPWNSRLELVYFVLFAPICGLALAKISPRLVLNLAAITLVIAALPWTVANKSRPLVGASSVLTTPRVDQYFADRKGLEPAYLGVASYLSQRQCVTVGLVGNIDDWEYPWWVTLDQSSGPLVIEHVNVRNDTSGLADNEPYPDFHPCAIIMTRLQLPATLDYNGVSYSLGWRSQPLGVYILR
ncbi:MAG TPA: glycosyltransferase family 39 protein [Ktedonobacterales bacterium]